MRNRVGVWAGIGAAVVTAAVLVVFWLVEGLEPAGWLAGVLSSFAALAALAITLLDRSRSQPHPPPPETAEGETGSGAVATTGTSTESISNTFTAGEVHGPVVMGRDIGGPITFGPRPPARPPSGEDDPDEEPGS